jgi:hypothetical protein
MAKAAHTIAVYLEVGKKRALACALDWPGWCRSGRDEESALAALLESAPRYAAVLKSARISFHPRADAGDFSVTERIAGNGSTDYGVPDIAPPLDGDALAGADLKRAQALLSAYWDAFEQAVETAEGKQLRKGPRGGGRELDAIVSHVVDAQSGYMNRVAWKAPKNDDTSRAGRIAQARQNSLDALVAAATGELPKQGPRGGKIWLPRYFARRSGWHVLDHVWEIEDRLE